jgi:hypothetical protein
VVEILHDLGVGVVFAAVVGLVKYKKADGLHLQQETIHTVRLQDKRGVFVYGAPRCLQEGCWLASAASSKPRGSFARPAGSVCLLCASLNTRRPMACICAPSGSKLHTMQICERQAEFVW